MAITIPNTFVDATIAQASQVNANFTAVKTFVDALQAGTNITAGAIQTAAIADNAITSVKITAGAVGTTAIADGSVTTAKLATPASGDSDQIVLGVQVFS